MEIITIAARKGGDGKTTTAHAVGAGLSLKGYKVLFVDLDSQANLTRRLNCWGVLPSIYEALNAKTDKDIKATIKQINNNISVIPGSMQLANFEKDSKGNQAFYCIEKMLKPIKSSFDYVIIDTAANFGVLTVAALTASNKVIMPTQATGDSFQGVQSLMQIIDRAKDFYNKRLKIAGILPTRYKNRIINRKVLEVMTDYAAQNNIKVFEPIRECVALQEAELLMQDIFTYAKRSNAAADYNLLLEELTK